jgi:hypothetical protein
VTIDANRELALSALTKVVGRGRGGPHVERLAGLLTGVEQAYFRAFPQLADELDLRSRPLRELWEAHGPGLLAAVGRLTDKRLIPDEATAAVVQPFAGGGGAAYAPCNTLTIEAVLANSLPRLPETLRLAWLAAQLNADLPDFVELLPPGTSEQTVALAMLPAVLDAAADLELVRPADELLPEAVDGWEAPLPAGGQTIAVVGNWWRTHRASPAPFNVALTALERLLREATGNLA